MELKLESSVTINKPIAEVFTAWSNIERFTEWWDQAEERRKISDGPLGVGTKYHAVDKMPFRRLESSLEITRYEPNTAIGGKLSGDVDGTWITHFQETADGTKMTFRTEANLSGVLGLMATIMKGQIQKNDQRALERFKVSIET